MVEALLNAGAQPCFKANLRNEAAEEEADASTGTSVTSALKAARDVRDVLSDSRQAIRGSQDNHCVCSHATR